MKKVLTIAGSDSSGGAGIQADIKTITVHRMYAMSVITALTAQNTTGVRDVMEATPEFVAEQLDCVFQDIRPDAVKIGMVSNAAIIDVIAGKLQEYRAERIVVDPVMVATSGGVLMRDGATETLIKRLLPLGTVITPNIPEAEALSGIAISDANGMLTAAEIIGKPLRGAVMIKGGHFTSSADDLLYMADTGRAIWLKSPHIDNPNTHGTGCTLSSAIACGLADGLTVEESVRRAKDFITGAIADGLDLGSGGGPLNHMYRLK